MRSGGAAAAAVRKSSKVVAPSGTVCCTLTVPPPAVNAAANASARPFDTALVSLTTAAFDEAARAGLRRRGTAPAASRDRRGGSSSGTDALGCAGSSPSVSDVSVFDGETSAMPFLARTGSAVWATPELYGPTTATTFGSAASFLAAAAPLSGSDESSSTRTLIVQPLIGVRRVRLLHRELHRVADALTEAGEPAVDRRDDADRDRARGCRRRSSRDALRRASRQLHGSDHEQGGPRADHGTSDHVEPFEESVGDQATPVSSWAVGHTRSATGWSASTSNPYKRAGLSVRIVRTSSSGMPWKHRASDFRVRGHVPSTCG